MPMLGTNGKRRLMGTPCAAATQTKTLTVTCWIIFVIFESGVEPVSHLCVCVEESWQWPSVYMWAVVRVVSPSIRWGAGRLCCDWVGGSEPTTFLSNILTLSLTSITISKGSGWQTYSGVIVCYSAPQFNRSGWTVNWWAGGSESSYEDTFAEGRW